MTRASFSSRCGTNSDVHSCLSSRSRSETRRANAGRSDSDYEVEARCDRERIGLQRFMFEQAARFRSGMGAELFGGSPVAAGFENRRGAEDIEDRRREREVGSGGI